MPFTQQFQSEDKSIKTMYQLSFKIDYEKSIELSKDKKLLKKFIINLMKDFHDPVPQMINETIEENLMATPVFDIDPLSIDQLNKFSNITLIGVNYLKLFKIGKLNFLKKKFIILKGIKFKIKIRMHYIQ
jgi:hypothetical protein